jgi:hypothetical protein
MASDAPATALHVVAAHRGIGTDLAHISTATAEPMMTSRIGSPKKLNSRSPAARITTTRCQFASARAAAQPRTKHQATTGTE